MDDEIFNDYLSDILKRRSKAFSSRGVNEASID